MNYIFNDQELNQLLQMLGEVPGKWSTNPINLIQGKVLQTQEEVKAKKEVEEKAKKEAEENAKKEEK